ncbi:MAG: 50S ribosomal protein L3 [Kiritimatiellia bacterium]
MEGLLGRKLGMTQVYRESGEQVPVTVLEVGPCVVLQKKTKSADGYDAVQLGFLDCKESRATKAVVGHCKKAGSVPKRFAKEFIFADPESVKAGDTLTAAIFSGIEYVDVQGVTKGKGFQGVMKLHHMKGGPMTHGGHSKRRIGSIGCRSYPGRIYKNKRMPGHMGHTVVTQQNLRVVAVRLEDNLLLVNGAVPGPVGGMLMVCKALKKVKKAS